MPLQHPHLCSDSSCLCNGQSLSVSVSSAFFCNLPFTSMTCLQDHVFITFSLYLLKPKLSLVWKARVIRPGMALGNFSPFQLVILAISVSTSNVPAFLSLSMLYSAWNLLPQAFLLWKQLPPMKFFQIPPLLRGFPQIHLVILSCLFHPPTGLPVMIQTLTWFAIECYVSSSNGFVRQKSAILILYYHVYSILLTK